MSRSRSRPASGTAARPPLPHPRIPAGTHLKLLPAIGALPQPCHVRDIAAAAGTGVWGTGIAMKFLVDCGLVEPVPGARGTYRATAQALSVAQAWSVSEQEGLDALRRAWGELWFVRSAQARLQDGPGVRTGLQLALLRRLPGPGHESAVNRLLDLMVATGFLVEEPDGFIRWHGHPQAPAAEVTATEESSTASPYPARAKDGSKDLARPVPPQATEPTEALPNRVHGTAVGATAGARIPLPSARHADAPAPAPAPATSAQHHPSTEGLLTTAFGLHDVLHLTSEEAGTLHDHLTGLLGILSAMHERSERHSDPLNATLLTPWTPLAIAACSRQDWLNTHDLVRQLAATAPFRRQPTNT
ncbi:hypothetical protein M2271_006882 [Streptomyces sp. LBL]|uniref:hypothetical protein n=1 Tax=Streptomyces sp. LBL TaxID=2940562 RepID=UPI002474FAC5|nr:hypothetical protein [Streptomyces sp. LBL]MDH6629047.1 hypothetical protein [Streptomyces sp. LBL]